MTKPLILLLEDDPDEAELMRQAFVPHASKCELVVVEEGEQAVAWLTRAASSPGQSPFAELRLVILDLKLPGMAGDEVLRILKADPRLGHLPALVMTSSQLPGDVARVLAAGVQAVLRKPLTFTELTGLVQAVLAFWLSPFLLRME